MFLSKKYFNFKTFPSVKMTYYHSFPALKESTFLSGDSKVDITFERKRVDEQTFKEKCLF